MRNDLLFIDGELVDLNDDTKITLSYKSNIFTDLSKIVSNNSYTIKLPNTVHNQRLIEHADIPACTTNFPRRMHEARYFRNGVEVISKAQATLISVGKTFDIALVWGNATAFASIVNDGKKLTNLSSTLYYRWEKVAPESSVPKIDYGFLESDAEVSYHYAIKATWIIDQIALDGNVSFVFSDRQNELLKKLIVPLLTRNDDERTAEKYARTLIGAHVVYDSRYGRYLLVFDKAEGSENRYYGTVDGYAQIGNYYSWYGSNLKNGKPKLSGHIEITFKDTNATPRVPVITVFKNNLNYQIDGVLQINPKSVEATASGFYKAVFDFKDEQTSTLYKTMGINGYVSILFAVENISNGAISSVSGDIKIVNMSEQVILETYFNQGQFPIRYDGRYPIVPNLPNMKQIEFLKAILAIIGVFPIPVGDGIVKFASVDEIIENKSKAVNWTRKVVASSHENKPKNMSYILENFAQNNRFKWKEDDTVIGNHDGNIVVNDSTIQYERDAVTLPFAASEMKDGVAYIPIYSYNQDGSLNYSPGNVQPRILYLDGVKGVFTGLDWEQLISDNYSNYAKLVSNPIIITENIEISDIDLKLLDVTVPVYLGQYGRYYAIISVKAENSGICECKLLQLEV